MSDNCASQRDQRLAQHCFKMLGCRSRGITEVLFATWDGCRGEGKLRGLPHLPVLRWPQNKSKFLIMGSHLAPTVHWLLSRTDTVLGATLHCFWRHLTAAASAGVCSAPAACDSSEPPPSGLTLSACLCSRNPLIMNGCRGMGQLGLLLHNLADVLPSGPQPMLS